MQNVQRYEVVERLAVGGMAEVFLARAHGEHGFRKDVAIKRILPNLAASAEFESRFIAEAKLAVDLSHTNIVQIFDFGRDDSSLFIAMEYVRGANLSEVLSAAAAAQTPLPVAAVMQIGIGIAHGLEYAHSRGIVHRDLSPSNVLVSLAGEVKVADFGIAKPVDSESAKNAIAGKWAYMSPEQSRGERVDARTDVFALGIVLHELLTTRRLFRRSHWEQTRAALLTDPIEPPSRARPEVVPEIDAVVMKALARDPQERFASCAALGRALSEACLAARIVHGPDDVQRLLASLALRGHQVQRPKTASTAADLATLRTLIRANAPGELTRWQVDATDTVDAASGVAQRTAPRNRSLLLATSALAVIVLGVVAVVLAPSSDSPAGAPAAPTAVAAMPMVIVDAAVAEALAVDAASPDEPVTKPAAPKPAPPSVPTQFATIAIQSSPWAHVYVGGKKRGTTPLAALRLPLGQHKIQLVNPELGVRKTVTVRVPSEQPYLFRLTE